MFGNRNHPRRLPERICFGLLRFRRATVQSRGVRSSNPLRRTQDRDSPYSRPHRQSLPVASRRSITRLHRRLLRALSCRRRSRIPSGKSRISRRLLCRRSGIGNSLLALVVEPNRHYYQRRQVRHPLRPLQLLHRLSSGLLTPPPPQTKRLRSRLLPRRRPSTSLLQVRPLLPLPLNRAQRNCRRLARYQRPRRPPMRHPNLRLLSRLRRRLLLLPMHQLPLPPLPKPPRLRQGPLSLTSL